MDNQNMETNAQGADNVQNHEGAQGAQNEKLFTQDDVNRIVGERLARVKNTQTSEDTSERMHELDLRERKLTARERLADLGISKDLLPLCDLQAMQKNMRETIDNLPEEQAQVIRWRYYDSLTLREIGEKLGCSGSKIRETERKAMRKLRAPHTSRKYQAYHEQYLTPYPIYHIGVESFQRTGFSEVERAVLGWGD